MAQTLCPLVSAEDRLRLAAIVGDRNRPQKHVARARIVLLAADRLDVAAVAREAGISRPAVWRWQRRYAEAELLAKRAKELDPESPVTETMLWKAKFARRDARIDGIRLAKEDGFCRPLPALDRDGQIVGPPNAVHKSRDDFARMRQERAAAEPGAGQAVLATWHELIDAGRMQDGDEHLAGTAKPVFARISANTAADVGIAGGELISVSTERGAVVLPTEVVAMPDRVVWLPTNARECAVRPTLGAVAGSVVTLTRPDAPPVVGVDA